MYSKYDFMIKNNLIIGAKNRADVCLKCSCRKLMFPLDAETKSFILMYNFSTFDKVLNSNFPTFFALFHLW